MRFSHYLGRACIYGEERKVKGKEIWDSRNKCAKGRGKEMGKEEM